MLTDRVFLRANALATEPLDHDVAVDGSTTRTRRVLRSPSAVARFTGPQLAVIEEISWNPADADQYSGTVRLNVEGLPAQLVGTVDLRPGGPGSVLTYAGELSVNIPILGPSLAKQAAPLLLEALATQQQVGQAYLSQQHS